MAADIPTTEPLKAMAGTTWQWTREDLDDYPASTYTLTYYLVNTSGQITIVATADGDYFDVTVAKAVTALYTPGLYQWVAVATDSTTAVEIDRGTIEVLPDLSAALASGYDSRTHAKKVLDALEAVIEGRASRADLEYTIGDRQIRFMSPGELIQWRTFYRGEYAREQAAQNIARGKSSGSKVKVKFI